MRMAWIGLVVVAGCNGGESDRATVILGLEGDPANGAVVYTDNCALCHMESGLGVNDGGSGPDLTEAAAGSEDGEIVDLLLNGREAMPAFDTLADQDLTDVVAYLHDGLF